MDPKSFTNHTGWSLKHTLHPLWCRVPFSAFATNLSELKLWNQFIQLITSWSLRKAPGRCFCPVARGGEHHRFDGHRHAPRCSTLSILAMIRTLPLVQQLAANLIHVDSTKTVIVCGVIACIWLQRSEARCQQLYANHCRPVCKSLCICMRIILHLHANHRDSVCESLCICMQITVHLHANHCGPVCESL